MTYFNLDLMEQDAKRRLAKSIDASTKAHLAKFAKLCEPKPVVSLKQVFDPAWQMQNSYNQQVADLRNSFPWNSQKPFGGMGGCL